MDTQHIETILMQLNTLYVQHDKLNDKSNRSLHIPRELLLPQDLLCKMAALELCGWLEDTFDDWIQNLLTKVMNKLQYDYHLDEYKGYMESYQKAVKKKMDNIHGLSYTRHFRTLLIQVLGDLTVLQLEKEIGLSNIECFSGILNNLHDYRGILAHKSYQNIQNSLDSPQVVFNKFTTIKPILEKFEDCLTKMSTQFN